MIKKIPEIRFNNYNDDWEERKLFEVARFNPKSELPDIFEYVDLDSVVGTEMVSHRTEELTTAPSRAQRLAQTGDVFFQTVRPYQRNNYLFTKPDENYVFSTGYAQMRPKIDAEFLMCFLQTDDFVKVVLDNCTGTSYPAINSNDLSNLSIALPASKDEQKKIGTFISNITNIITLHQREYCKLKKIKRTMLEKMFPKDGKNVPEIRFDGFTDDWEQHKLGELLEVTSVKRIHQSDWTDSGIRFLRARDIVAESKNEEVTEPLFISEEKYEEYSALSGKVKPGDLLVTGVGTIGVSMLINSEEPLYFKDGNIIWFKNNNTIDGMFLFYSFNGASIQSFIKESAGIGTVGTYTIDSGKKTPIKLPAQTEEQIQIGKFFENLDNLITLYHRKINKYENIKKSMLERMFV